MPAHPGDGRDDGSGEGFGQVAKLAHAAMRSTAGGDIHRAAAVQDSPPLRVPDFA